MACATCGHTMHGMGYRITGKTFYWCPRCGTILACEDTPALAPALVERCRTFARHLYADAESVAELQREWHRLGIAESIARPEQRSTHV